MSTLDSFNIDLGLTFISLGVKRQFSRVMTIHGHTIDGAVT